MSKRQTVTETVFWKEVHGSITQDQKYHADTVQEVIDWLIGLLATIPAKYRATATIQFESVGGYEGSHTPEVTVSYKRLETDEEYARRQESERQRSTHQRDVELAQLAALKAKYEGQN